MPLQEWLEVLPESGKGANPAERGQSSRKAKGNRDELLAKYPWLEKLWDDGKPGLFAGEAKEKKSSASTGGFDAGDDDSGANLVDDEEIEVLWDELHRYRSNLAAAALSAPGDSDFMTTCLGGKWTKEHKGVDADAVRGHARGESAVTFCEARGVNKSKRFEISVYTFGHAAVFARAWCHRMQYFFNLACEAEDYMCGFSLEQISAYEAPTEFTAAAQALGHERACSRAAAQIRELFL